MGLLEALQRHLLYGFVMHKRRDCWMLWHPFYCYFLISSILFNVFYLHFYSSFICSFKKKFLCNSIFYLILIYICIIYIYIYIYICTPMQSICSILTMFDSILSIHCYMISLLLVLLLEPAPLNSPLQTKPSLLEEHCIQCVHLGGCFVA